MLDTREGVVFTKEKEAWRLFAATGAPGAYMIYVQKRQESSVHIKPPEQQQIHEYEGQALS